MTRPDENAFPCNYFDGGIEYGLSKREYIATMILQGLLSNKNIVNNLVILTEDQSYIIDRSLEITDRLISKM